MSEVKTILVQSVFPLARTALAGLARAQWPTARVIEGASVDELAQRFSISSIIDLLIVDWRAPEQAEATIRGLAMRRPHAVLALTRDASAATVKEARRAGADAVVESDSDAQSLRALMDFVLRGGSCVPASVLEDTLASQPPGYSTEYPVGNRAGTHIGQQAGSNTGHGRFTVSQDNPAFAALTRRQKEVLSLVSRGLSNEEISVEMGVTLNTVKSHVSSMLRALGVRRRTQAMRILSEGGARV